MGTQSTLVQTGMEWAVALLLYPGLLFGGLLVLAGDWLVSALRSLFTRRTYRVRLRPQHPLQPLYDTLRLAGRHATGDVTYYVLRITYYASPILALALLPFSGSAIARWGDIFVVLTLLAVQPVCGVVLRLNGVTPLAAFFGGREIGRLVTGLAPALAAVAALVAASGGRSLVLADLTAAPETGWQALVRLLAGAALLASLAWWLAPNSSSSRESASVYAGQRLQRAALAAFWTALVLPMPSDPTWALAVSIIGALFAYAAMHLISERAASTLREGEAARLAWATALPVAALSLVVELALS